MIKKLLFALLAFVSLSASAAPANIAALKAYVTRALTQCPDSKIVLEPIDQPSPAGFLAYTVTQTSSDSACGRQTFLLYSPATSQVIIGAIFGLPLDDRNVEIRVGQTASELMKQNLTVSVAPFPLPDGLRAVSMIRQTKWGPFSYHAFVDASQRFMIVGMRGSLYVDPGRTLIESLGIENAVRRGNPKATVKIIELSDFECPSCARAHKDVEPLIAKHIGKIDYGRLDLPLFEHHEWAVPAALGGWAIERVAPAKYWTYVNFVFENQDAIGKSRSFDKVLQDFCEDHDIDWKGVEKIYHSPTERATLLEQVSRAFDNGIFSTPTYIINGQVLGFGPSGKETIAAIKRAIGVK